ncbi:MAG: YHYH protein [Chloroflexi bacterium]|nr:YHYH protein [Chloroflexota bacterium]
MSKRRIARIALAAVVAFGSLTFALARPTPAALGQLGASSSPAAGTATSDAPVAPSVAPQTAGLPAPYGKLGSNVVANVVDDQVVIRANSVPDHGSPYFAPTDPRYEPYNGSNPSFRLNPNRIAEQTLVFRLPLSPQRATTNVATPLGPIGVALNGVAIFNQYAAQRAPLTNEINSFDQYNGHPERTGLYHYHVEPLALTQIFGKDALLGFLLDGFPVYGPEENGRTITNADLDQFHGHYHATPEYPNGGYHYHVTAEAPYVNGNGFYGTPGSVGRAR